MVVKIILGIIVAVSVVIVTMSLLKIIRYGLRKTDLSTEQIGKILKRNLIIMTAGWGIIVVCGMMIILL